jgi:hypothetical protein
MRVQLPATGPYSGLVPGLFFDNHIVDATNRTGATTGVGEIVMFDLAQSATEVDNGTPGSSDASGANSSYNNYIDPSVAVGLVSYFFGIALESIADNTTGQILVRGRVNAKVAAACVAGSVLMPAADGTMIIRTGATDGKIVAIAETDDSAVTNYADVLFDGIQGFGWDVVT